MAQSSYLSDERKLATQGLQQGSKRTLPMKPEIADREGFGQAMQMKRDAQNAEMMPGGMPQRMNTLQRKGLEVGGPQEVAEQEADRKADEIAGTKVPVVQPVPSKENAPASKREGEGEHRNPSKKEGVGTEKSSGKPQQKTQAGQEKQLATPTAAPAVAGPMTRAQFEQIMRTTYGVTTIRDASHDEQVQNNRIPLTPPAMLPNWSAWGPGSSSETYNKIVDGFAEFARIWGGVPVVNEINFMRVNYVESGGVVQENPNEAAAFGLYDLNIYKGFETRRAPLPVGKSKGAGHTAMDSPTQMESIVRSTVHELSHGIGVAAAQPMYAGNSTPPMPGIFTEWNQAIGWSGGRLYDIGHPDVASAIKAGATPPGQYRIHSSNWDASNWLEQPVSAYSTTRPSEDFAESVMTYSINPSLLQSRSPARYAFIHSRRALLQTRLRRPTPASAAPTPATTPTPVVP